MRVEQKRLEGTAVLPIVGKIVRDCVTECIIERLGLVPPALECPVGTKCIGDNTPSYGILATSQGAIFPRLRHVPVVSHVVVVEDHIGRYVRQGSPHRRQSLTKNSKITAFGFCQAIEPEFLIQREQIQACEFAKTKHLVLSSLVR